MAFSPPPAPRVRNEADAQCDCACFALESSHLPRLSSPLSFYLELTADCNNHCAGCGNTFAPPGSRRTPLPNRPPLDAAAWQRVLHALQPYARRLKITGGEPMLHAEFEEIVEQVAALKVPFTVFSNGRWQQPERIIRLLRALPGCEGVLISLHGATATGHEAFSGVRGSFVQTVQNILQATQAGLTISVSCVLTRHNWQQADDMLALAHSLGAKNVVFNRYVGQDPANLAPSPNQLRAAVSRIVTLRASGQAVKLGNCLPACFAPTDQAGCLAGLAFFTVDPWGQVRPCNHAPLLCGSLLEQSVPEIWCSDQLALWRSSLPAACETCSARLTCRGGCRAQALALGREADPLLVAPLAGDPPLAPRPMTLYEGSRPRGVYERREEAFGPVLLRGNRLVPVPRADEPVLALLDGQTTLRQIEAACGARGLSLVAALYNQGLVELN